MFNIIDSFSHNEGAPAFSLRWMLYVYLVSALFLRIIVCNLGLVAAGTACLERDVIGGGLVV